MRYFLAFLGLLASSAAPPAAVIDATAASRIGFSFAASGGVAMMDTDGDGLDLFFVNGASVAANQVFVAREGKP